MKLTNEYQAFHSAWAPGMKIFLGGLGALGSNIGYNLILANPEHEYIVMDNGKVEERNLKTQIYHPDQIGMTKNEAFLYFISLYGNYNIFGIYEDFVKTDRRTIQFYDLYIDCFDNEPARKKMTFLLPCLHIAFSNQLTFEILWDDNFKPEQGNYEGDICNMAGALPFIKMVTGLATSVIQHYIQTGEKLNYIGNALEIKKL